MSAKAISVLIVSFFVVCSFAPMLADADAETNDTLEKSVLIDFEKSDYKDKVQKVTKQPLKAILGEFGVYERGYTNEGPFEIEFDVDATMTSLTYSCGNKVSWNGTTQTMDSIELIETEFKIILTAKSDTQLHVEVNPYILGDDYPKYIAFLKTNLTAGQSVEFGGKIISESHSLIEEEYYKSESLGGLLPKSSKMTLTECIDLDGKVKIGDRECGYKNQVKDKAITTVTNDYGKELGQVKIGDEYKMLMHTDLEKMDFSTKVDVGEGFKDAKFDMDKYKENIKDSETKERLNSTIPEEIVINDLKQMVVQVGLVDELAGKSVDDIKKAFDAVGGKYLVDDFNAYNDKVNKVEKDVSGSGSDNTVMIAIIVIVIIIIIALLALWYFKFRPQQAAQPKQPQQPEQPQQ